MSHHLEQLATPRELDMVRRRQWSRLGIACGTMLCWSVGLEVAYRMVPEALGAWSAPFIHLVSGLPLGLGVLWCAGMVVSIPFYREKREQHRVALDSADQTVMRDIVRARHTSINASIGHLEARLDDIRQMSRTTSRWMVFFVVVNALMLMVYMQLPAGSDSMLLFWFLAQFTSMVLLFVAGVVRIYTFVTTRTVRRELVTSRGVSEQLLLTSRDLQPEDTRGALSAASVQGDASGKLSMTRSDTHG